MSGLKISMFALLTLIISEGIFSSTDIYHSKLAPLYSSSLAETETIGKSTLEIDGTTPRGISDLVPSCDPLAFIRVDEYLDSLILVTWDDSYVNIPGYALEVFYGIQGAQESSWNRIVEASPDPISFNLIEDFYIEDYIVKVRPLCIGSDTLYGEWISTRIKFDDSALGSTDYCQVALLEDSIDLHNRLAVINCLLPITELLEERINITTVDSNTFLFLDSLHTEERELFSVYDSLSLSLSILCNNSIDSLIEVLSYSSFGNFAFPSIESGYTVLCDDMTSLNHEWQRLGLRKNHDNYIEIHNYYRSDEEELLAFALRDLSPSDPGCLMFDGSDYAFTTEDVFSDIGTGDFTIEAWINGQESLQGSYPQLVSNRTSGSTSTQGLLFGFHNASSGSNIKRLYLQLGGRNYPLFNNGTYNASVLEGITHHVAAVRQADTVRYYIDGIEIGERITVGIPSVASTANTYFGFDNPNNGNGFEGSISELRVWNRVLSGSEIFDNHDNSIPIATPNLVAYWQLQEGSGQVVYNRETSGQAQLGSSNSSDSRDPIWSNDCTGNLQNCLDTFDFSVAFIDPVCNESFDGTITISGFDSSFVFSVGDPSGFQTDSVFTDLDTGIYYITIQDGDIGCIVATDTISLFCETCFCIEICDNLIDDDGDGLVDCEDDDCTLESHCIICDCGFNVMGSSCVATEIAYDTCVRPQLLDIVDLFDIEIVSGGISICALDSLTSDQQDLLHTYRSQNLVVSYDVSFLDSIQFRYIAQVDIPSNIDTVSQFLCFIIPFNTENISDIQGEINFIYEGVQLDSEGNIQFEISDTVGNFVLGQYSPDSLSEGLVLHYNFCNCGVADVSGNSLNATITGDPTCDEDGKGITLNATIGINDCGRPGGDYLEMPTLGAIWEDGITMNVWANFEGVTWWERLIDIGNGTGQSGGYPVLFARHGSSSSLVLESWNNTSSINQSTGRLIAPNAIKSNQRALYTATIESDQMKIYVDGELVASKTGNPIFNIARIKNYIGHSNWCSADSDFTGTIEDVRIYNRALNQDEITRLYSEGGNKCVDKCNNALDDDQDGMIDNNCLIVISDTPCKDGIDNDGDGLIDCEDGDCAMESNCIVCKCGFNVMDISCVATQIAYDTCVRPQLLEITDLFEISLVSGGISICALDSLSIDQKDLLHTYWSQNLEISYSVPQLSASGQEYIARITPTIGVDITEDSLCFLIPIDQESYPNLEGEIHFIYDATHRNEEDEIELVVAEDTLRTIQLAIDAGCGNGVDDDGDGVTDCDDEDCLPTYSFSITPPSCPDLDDGVIEIYVISIDDDGMSCSDTIVFNSLIPGEYSYDITSNGGCTTTTDLIVIIDNGCPEICDNNIDDDGDGLVDCEDGDCGLIVAFPVVADIVEKDGHELKNNDDPYSISQPACDDWDEDLGFVGQIELYYDFTRKVNDVDGNEEDTLSSTPFGDVFFPPGIEQDVWFRLDTGIAQIDPIFESIPVGEHTISIENINGCQEIIEFEILNPIPIYFLPTAATCITPAILTVELPSLVDLAELPAGDCENIELTITNSSGETKVGLIIYEVGTTLYVVKLRSEFQEETFDWEFGDDIQLSPGNYTISIDFEVCPSYLEELVCEETYKIEVGLDCDFELCNNEIDDDNNNAADCEDLVCERNVFSIISLPAQCPNYDDGLIQIDFDYPPGFWPYDSDSIRLEFNIYDVGDYNSIVSGYTYAQRNGGVSEAYNLTTVDEENVEEGIESSAIQELLSLQPGSYEFQFTTFNEYYFLNVSCVEPVAGFTIDSFCPNEICGNSIDDDGDGLIDCEDGDCGPMYTYELQLPTCPTGNDGSINIYTDISEGSLGIEGFQDTLSYTSLESGEYQYDIENFNGCLITTAVITLAIDSSFIGASCDDGDACTINDIYGADCNCEGTFADSDNDGVCDAEDQCPGQDDNIDVDNDTIPDGCDTDCTIPISLESFNNTRGDFTYVSGLFGISNPTYEVESIQSNSLQIEIGGVNNSNQQNLSGGWITSFDVVYESQVIVTMTYEMLFPGDFEEDEYSEVQISIDGSNVNYNGNPYIDRLEGVVGGNGPDQTSGNQEVSISLGVLSAGSHALAIGLFNNQKTWNNEITTLILDEVAIDLSCPTDPVDSDGDGVFDEIDQCPGSDDAIDVDTDGIPDGCDLCIGVPDIDGDGICDDIDLCTSSLALLTEDFNSGQGDFTYVSGAFSSSQAPYDAGSYASDALTVTLGGQDGATVTDMSGGWSTTIENLYQGDVEITFSYEMILAANYEANQEYSEVRVSVDGQLYGSDGNTYIDRIDGDNNGGPDQTTGVQSASIVIADLSEGAHTITIGAFNNQKTFTDEVTILTIDNVSVSVACPDVQVDSDGDGVFDELDICDGGDDNIDTDNDGTPDFCDPCPLSIDSDEDGICDDQDLCISKYKLLESSLISVEDSVFVESYFNNTDTRLVQFQDVNRGKEIIIGGFNNDRIFDIYGGVTVLIDVPYEAEMQLNLTYEMIASFRNDNNEDSELRIRVDSNDIIVDGEGYVSRLEGVRGNGADLSTGLEDVEIQLGTLSMGTHSLSIGVYQSKKNRNNEITTLYIEQVALQLDCPSEQVDSDGDGVFDEVDICEGGDDDIDFDNDGTPDFCDPCPATLDLDGDGVCDEDDLCIISYDLLETTFSPEEVDPFEVVYINNTNAQNTTIANISRGKKITIDSVPDRTRVDDLRVGIASIIEIPYAATTELSIRYELISSRFNGNNEDCEIRILMDGQELIYNGNSYIDQIEGVGGNNTPDDSSGVVIVPISLGVMNPGPHEIVIEIYQSKMNRTREFATLILEEVSISIACSATSQIDSDRDGIYDDVDVCSGGDDNIDFDLDGIPDFCDPCPYQKEVIQETAISINSIVPAACPLNNNGSVLVNADFIGAQLSIDGGVNYQSSPEFSNLTPGAYIVHVRHIVDECFGGASLVVVIPGGSCDEICDNGIDDDGDGNIDCADEKCFVPSIAETITTNETCAGNTDASITIVGVGSGLEYSIDGGSNYSNEAEFYNLTTGIYEVVIRSNLYNCESAVESIEIFASTCDEVCNNNIDDDGDGDIDEADSDCGTILFVSTTIVQATLANCPNPNDGAIVIEASGDNLLYSIDDGTTYHRTNEFIGLAPGTYQLIIKHEINNTSLTLEEVILEDPVCVEICDNEIDDDGDGDTDCEDEDCSLQDQAFSFCVVYDHISGLGQSNNQGLIYFEKAAIPTFDLLISEGVYEFVDVEVSYVSNSTGVNITVNQSIGLDGNLVLPTWALQLSDITYDSDIVIRIGVGNEIGCNQYCSDVKVISLEFVEDEVEVIEDESNYGQFKNYECGEEFTPEELVTDIFQDLLSSGDILNIYGFPLIVEQLSDNVDGGDGIAGSGIVVLPFNNKSIKVAFAGLQINVNKEITVGEVSGTTSDNFDITEIIGSGSPEVEICVEKECEVDGYGFDCDGKHLVTGTMLDERDFRQDGNYKDTGQPYNEKGCNRDNRDIDNNICFSGEASSQIVEDYINDNEELVFTTIGTQLQSISDEQQTVIQTVNAACGLIRDEMNPIMTGLTSTLSLSREFVFGPGESGSEKYFGPGMSANFTSEPKILDDGTPRNAEVKQLEALHVDLYYCDTLYVSESDLKERVDLLLSESQDDLRLEIIAILSQVSDDQIATFTSDPKTLEAWIKNEITRILSNTTDQTTGYVEPTIRLLDIERSSIDDLGISPSLVALDDMFPGSSMEDIQDEILFQIQQGSKKINNIHSAFFLEQMAIVNEEEENGLLPLKLLNVNLGITTTVYLSGVTISENGATLDAFVILEDPFNNTRRMVFEATGVPFTPGGFDGGNTTLTLVEDFEIKVSNKIKLTLNKDETKAMWDCQGFAGLSIDGNVELCRDVVIPLESDRETVIPDPARFQGYFNLAVDSWSDVVIMADVQPFAIASSPDFKFDLTNLIVDISGVRTPEQMKVPEGYESPHLIGGKFGPTWEGVYIEQLNGSVPYIKNREGGIIPITVDQFLVDGYGLSGTISATDLLPFDDGQLEGWGISIDKLSLGVLQNRLANASMLGDLQIPVLSDKLAYDASWLQNGGFSLSVGIAENQEVPFFLGDVTLFRGSGAKFTLDDGNPRLSALLHGSVNFGMLDAGVAEITLPTFSFHELEVHSDPSISLGTWKITDGDGGFDVFNMLPENFKIYKPSEDEVGISFPLNISLVDKIGLTARGDVGVVAEYIDGDIQKWEYKGIDLRSFYIKQSIKERIDIEGELIFFNPEDFPAGTVNYGKGFRGSLCTNFKDFNLEVGALAQFGKVDDGQESPIDYFLIDALADLPIDITLGPIVIYGFGGGVSYNMINNMEATAINFTGAGDGVCGNLIDLPLGSTLSEIVYEPSRDVGLGIRATTLLYAGNERVFNGSATLQLLFNSDDNGGGVRDVSLFGNGQFLADVDLGRLPDFELVNPIAVGDKDVDVPAPPPGVISAFIDLKYSPGIRTFTGDLATYMNAGPLKGINKNGLVCFADIYYSPKDWHIFLGTPQERCGLLFDLGFLEADFGSYFDIGTDLPQPAGLPQELNNLFNKNKPQESLRNSGAGFMLGTNMNFESQMDIKVAAAAIKVILGFDIMVRDFEDATCDGEQVGIDGWMASGQIYGYLHGAIKVLGIKVLSAGVAALLQARMPDPTNIRAALAVTAKILLFEKTIDFDVNIGDDCQIQSNDPNDPLGLNIISHAIPDGGSQRLGTDVEPIVYFSLPIDRDYKLVDDTYRASIHSISMNSSIGPVDISYKVNEGSYSLNILPFNFLPATEIISYEVKLEIFKNGISQGFESQIFEFNTAEEIGVLPSSNIEYAYPADGLYDFFILQDQNQKGVIQLERGQPSLFADPEVAYFIRLERKGYEAVELPVRYELFNRRLEYDLSGIEKEAIYRASLIRRDDRNALTEEPLLDPIHFRVSRYDRFSNKIEDINSLNLSGEDRQLSACDGNDFSFSLIGIEPFGQGYEEVVEGRRIGAFTLPRRENLNDWYSNSTLQLMEEGFSFTVDLLNGETLDPIADINDSDNIKIEGASPIVTEGEWRDGGFPENVRYGQRLIYDIPCKLKEQFDYYKKEIQTAVPEITTLCNPADELPVISNGPLDPNLEELTDVVLEFMCRPWISPSSSSFLSEGYKIEATYDVPHIYKRTHYIIIDDSKIKN